MIKEKSTLLFFSAGLMELSWIYAFAVFCLRLLDSPAFPLLGAAAAFFAAAAITSFYRGRGWRIIQALGLHLLGFSAAGLGNLYVYYGCTEPIFSKSWVAGLFCQPREPLEGLTFGLIIFLSAVFWAGGFFSGLRPSAYLSITSRFDLGIAVFFFIMLVCGGIGVTNPVGDSLLLPFFLFSMLSIVLARNSGSGRREYLAGYRGVGLLMVFAVLVIVFTGSTLLLFLPYLSMAADAGYEAVKVIAAPVGSVLIALLRFLFGRRSLRTDAGDSGLSGDGDLAVIEPVEGSWWTEILQKVLLWGGAGLLLLLALFVAAWGIRSLLRWLFRKTPEAEEHRSIREELLMFLRVWWYRIQAFIAYLRGILSRSSLYQGQVAVFYRRLLLWGRTSGFPTVLSETPFEYGMRLGHHFPKAKQEIGLIVEKFNLEIYGEKTPQGETLSELKHAWRKLNSPFFWPARFMKWFFQDGLRSDRPQKERV